MGGNVRYWSEIDENHPQLVAAPQQGQINIRHGYCYSNKYVHVFLHKHVHAFFNYPVDIILISWMQVLKHTFAYTLGCAAMLCMQGKNIVWLTQRLFQLIVTTTVPSLYN